MLIQMNKALIFRKRAGEKNICCLHSSGRIFNYFSKIANDTIKQQNLSHF